MTYEILRIVYCVIFALLIFRLLIVYIEVFIIFMLNQKNSQYDKQVERPRLLFHIIAFIVIGLSFIPIHNLTGCIEFNWEATLLLSISTILFISGGIIVVFSWSKMFKNKYIPLLESRIIAKYQLKLKSNINIDSLCRTCIEKQAIDKDSIDDFKLLLQGAKCDSPIKWTEKSLRSKQISYKPLFNLLHEIIEGGFLPQKVGRDLYLSFVIDNFIIEGVQFEKNLPARYSEWITEMNK